MKKLVQILLAAMLLVGTLSTTAVAGDPVLTCDPFSDPGCHFQK